MLFRSSVLKTLISSAETYGERFLNRLDGVGKAGEPVRILLEAEGIKDSDRVEELLGVAAEAAGIETVLYSDGTGAAVDQRGNSLTLGETEWFQEVLTGENPYIYAEEVASIAVVKPVSTDGEQGYLILLYPMSQFADMLMNSGFDSTSFLAVVDMEGNVLGASGSTTNEIGRASCRERV